MHVVDLDLAVGVAVAEPRKHLPTPMGMTSH